MSPAPVTRFALSPIQRRLWRATGTSELRSAELVVQITGPLEFARLSAAVRRLVNDNEILRTTISLSPRLNVPTQQIHAQNEHDTRIDIEDSSDRDASALPEASRRKRPAPASQTHPAETGSPLALRLVRLSADQHQLVCEVPALCADYRSLELIVRGLARAYVDPKHSSPERDLEYADVAEWLNGFGEDPDHEAMRWWTEQIVATERLPCERAAGPPHAAGHGDMLIEVDEELLDRLDEAERRNGVDRAAMLLAAWAVLLERQASGPLSIGIELDGRNFEELTEIMGPLSRIGPCRVGVDPGESVGALLRRVHRDYETAIDTQQHYLWGRSGEEADNATGYGFAYRSTIASISAGRTRFDTLLTSTYPESFRLALIAYAEKADGSQTGACTLRLELWYDRANLTDRTAALLSEQYRHVLRKLTERPDRILDQLAPRVDTVAEPPIEIAVPPPETTCVHEIVSDLGARYPDDPAVSDGERTLSRRELERAADEIAYSLQSLGVAPRSRVALLVDRSVDAVVATLGTLKAGCVYLPLEPGDPVSGHGRVLRNARVAAVVTDGSVDLDDAEIPCRVLRLGDAAERQDASAQEFAEPSVDTHDLCYIISTSGSGGHRKLVGIEHRQAVAYSRRVSQRLALPPNSRYAIASTLAADLGLTCVLGALCHGGTLYVVPPEDVLDAERFGDFMQEHRIDCLKITPSHLRALLSGKTPRNILPKRALVLGGEATGWELFDQIRELDPRCRVINHYGPTETTVGVCAGEVRSLQRSHSPSGPPLDKPWPGSRFYVLDRALHPVSTWQPGELYIGGEQVGRGYLDRPGETAERLLPDPWSPTPGARMYRTGDLVRRIETGRLEFLDRVDRQVKIRGTRIELGEIDAVLRELPEVAQAHAVVRSDPRRGRELVAYCVLHPGAQCDPDMLREHLARHLTPAALPRAIVPLDTLPLTANGKIDTARLPAPSCESGAGTAPRSATEREILAVWRESLGITNFGVRDNFFDLGGHSLLLVRIHYELRKRLNREFPILELFRHPTVEVLARFLDQQGNGSSAELFGTEQSRQRAQAQHAAIRRLRERSGSQQT